MLVKDAIAEQLIKIEEAELRRRLAELEAKAAAEVKRQEFINTLSERIELQYGLELTVDDIAAWEVICLGGNRYDMGWNMPHGGVRLDSYMSIEEVQPGGCAKLWWRAWYNETYRQPTVTLEALLPALVYAQTGKQL